MTAELPVFDGICIPWGSQAAFLKPGALFRRYQGGQGSGKTLSGVFQIRRWARALPGSIWIATEPTYPMIRDVLIPEFDRQFLEAGEEHMVEFRGSPTLKYVLSNGAEIWLRQCEHYDALRGPSVAGVWMDEAAQSPHAAFQILCGRMRQRGFPHLFMCTGTPRGKNWLHWVFTKGERPDNAPLFIGESLEDLRVELDFDGPLVESFFASSLKNPYLDPVARAVLQSAFTPGTPLYRQEVLGETTVFEGLVYVEFDENVHVREAPSPREFVRYILAQDWGWTNPGVQLLIGETAGGTLWVLDEAYKTKKMVPWWAQRAKDLEQVYKIDQVVCDPSEPDNIALFNAKEVRALPADNSVIPGITAVGGRLGQGTLFISPGCLNTLAEIRSYQWKSKRKGGVEEIQNDEPLKSNDHAMDTLRYGVMAFRRPPAEQGSGGTTAPTGRMGTRRAKGRSYYDGY